MSVFLFVFSLAICSWDEMSALDLDTMINRVLNMTGHDDLYYIGHSQGTLIMFGKLAKDPKFHKKVNFNLKQKQSFLYVDQKILCPGSGGVG